MIERFKAIAIALSDLTGREITEPMVRAWSRRSVDPLPVAYFAGRPGIDEKALAEWADRQKGQRKAKGETQSPQLTIPPQSSQS